MGGNGGSNGPNLEVACLTFQVHSICLARAQSYIPIFSASEEAGIDSLAVCPGEEQNKFYDCQQISVTVFISTIKSNTQRNVQTCRRKKRIIEIFIHSIEGQERGQKAARKEDGKQKIQNKTGEITPKISVITIHINTVTSQFKQSSTTGFLQGKFLKQTHT